MSQARHKQLRDLLKGDPGVAFWRVQWYLKPGVPGQTLPQQGWLQSDRLTPIPGAGWPTTSPASTGAGDCLGLVCLPGSVLLHEKHWSLSAVWANFSFVTGAPGQAGQMNPLFSGPSQALQEGYLNSSYSVYAALPYKAPAGCTGVGS